MIAEPEKHERRCLVFTGSDASRELANPAEISDILKADDTFVWFDLASPTTEDLALLQEEFSLHPLAIEDAALAHERPKIDTYDGYALIVVQGAGIDESGKLAIGEVAIFAGKNFLVTIRTTPLWPIDEVEKRWGAHWGPIQRDSLGLLYVILDTIVDGYYLVTHTFEERVDQLEGHLFARDRGAQTILREIFTLKRNLTNFRRAVAPVRDILTPLMRGDIQQLEPAVVAYYRDVYDHLLRVLDMIESQRDLVNSSLDIHLSAQSHRQGEVNKQLTIIATIFLPLTYITGFFGQNFDFLIKGISGPSTFWWIGIGSQIVTLVGLLWFFRYKRWF